MFTGIVTALGTVREVQPIGGGHDLRLVMGVTPDFLLQPTPAVLGASICCSGVCLTVVQLSADSFSVDASAETVAKTTLGGWKKGSKVNLERALKLGDELGGHIVSGHVDGVAEVVALHAEGDSLRVTFRAPNALAKFIAPKGSIALNGTSLTVNEVNGAEFGINFIPHTQAVTTWGQVALGDLVNLEVDTMARYVARLREWD